MDFCFGGLDALVMFLCFIYMVAFEIRDDLSE